MTEVPRTPGIFHIGAFKAGSTFMDAHYTAHPEICKISRLRLFQSRHMADRALSVQNYLKYAGKDIQELFDPGTHKVVLDFDQNMFMGYLTRQYWQYRAWHRNFYKNATFDHEEAPSRIQMANPAAKVVFCIRRQPEWLQSTFNNFRINKYRHFYKRHIEMASLLDFLDTVQGKATLAAGRYDVTIDCYARLLGRENVHVYLLEDLRDDYAGTVRRISDFIGVSPFESMDHDEKAKNRAKAYRFTIDPDLMRMIECFYAAGNQRLMRYVSKRSLVRAGYIKASKR